jgi:hypothetical protein
MGDITGASGRTWVKNATEFALPNVGTAQLPNGDKALPLGMRHQLVSVLTRGGEVESTAMPDMVPSGAVRKNMSCPLSKLKEACNCFPVTARSFLESQTVRYPLEGILVSVWWKHPTESRAIFVAQSPKGKSGAVDVLIAVLVLYL